MAFGIYADFEDLREVAFGDIGATYAVFGAAFTDYPRALRIVNGTDADVYISTNGIKEKLRVNANSFLLWDVSANKQANSQLWLPKFQIYQKRVSGTPASRVTLWMETLIGIGGK